MSENNFYSDEKESGFEKESNKISLDKPQQSIYEEGTSPRRGEYRQTSENRSEAYRENGYSGNPYQHADQYPYQQENQGLGIASMVLGILSLVLFCACINIPLSIAAIVLGILHLTRPGAKKGTAIAGIVTSVISMILFAISVLAFVSSVDFSDDFRKNIESRIGEDFFEEYNFPDHHIDDHNTF